MAGRMKRLLFSCVACCLFLLHLPISANSQGLTNKDVLKPALVSNGGMLKSFSDATHLELRTADDYGRFVDPQITGANRGLAIHFLRIMPAGMRGDFVYVSRSGMILSNRVALGFGIRPLPRAVAASLRHNRIFARPAAAPRLRRLAPAAYPPNGGTGGAYIRTYSQQGINAMITYVSPPCDFSLSSLESGNMYINAYDPGGNDIVDTGLGTGITQTTQGGNLGNMVAFTTPYSIGFSGLGWTNQAQTYPCGKVVGMIYGTLPASLGGGSMLGTGAPTTIRGK